MVLISTVSNYLYYLIKNNGYPLLKFLERFIIDKGAEEALF